MGEDVLEIFWNINKIWMREVLFKNKKMIHPYNYGQKSNLF